MTVVPSPAAGVLSNPPGPARLRVQRPAPLRYEQGRLLRSAGTWLRAPMRQDARSRKRVSTAPENPAAPSSGIAAGSRAGFRDRKSDRQKAVRNHHLRVAGQSALPIDP